MFRAAVFLLLACSLNGVAGRKRTGNEGTHIALRVYELANCGDPINYVRFLDPINIKLGRDGGHMVDVNVSVDRTITSVMKGELKVTRCREAMSSNTCEYFGTWSFSSVCALFARKNVLWSPIVESVTPPLRCPLPKGIYKATNTTCDMDVPFVRAVVDGYVFKGRVTFTDQDGVEMMCGHGAIGGLKIRRGKP